MLEKEGFSDLNPPIVQGAIEDNLDLLFLPYEVESYKYESSWENSAINPLLLDPISKDQNEEISLDFNQPMPPELSSYNAGSFSQTSKDNVINEEKHKEQSIKSVDRKAQNDKKTRGKKRIPSNRREAKSAFANIAKITVQSIFGKWKNFTKGYVQRKGIKFQDFEQPYITLIQGKNYSRKTLQPYFIQKEGDQRQITRCFTELFEKYLRKNYMLCKVKAEKNQSVQKMEWYIPCKNQQVLYFSEYCRALTNEDATLL